GVDDERQRGADEQQLHRGPQRRPGDRRLEPEPAPRGEADGDADEEQGRGELDGADVALAHRTPSSSASANPARKAARSSAVARRPAVSTTGSGSSRSAWSRSWVTQTTGTPVDARSTVRSSSSRDARGSSEEVTSS